MRSGTLRTVRPHNLTLTALAQSTKTQNRGVIYRSRSRPYSFPGTLSFPSSATMEAKPSNTAAPAFSRIEFAKRQAAYKAVADHFNPAADYVGIGSGSTVVYVVEAIAAKGSDVTSNITFIPTGFQSKELIVDACLPLGSIDSLVRLEAVPTGTNSGWKRRRPLGLQDVEDDGTRVLLDVVFDGADEVDEELNCIKGGGACLFQEKLVATSARKFVCVAGNCLPHL